MSIDQIYLVGFIIGMILLIPLTLFEIRRYRQLNRYENRFQGAISGGHSTYNSSFHNINNSPPMSILEYYSNQDTLTLHLIHLDLLADKEEANNKLLTSNIASLGIPTIAVFASIIGLVTSKIEGSEGMLLNSSYSMVFILIVLFMIISSTIESVFQSLSKKRISRHLLVVEKVIDLQRNNMPILNNLNPNQSQTSTQDEN